MSVSLEVFLKRENLPSREAWQRAIEVDGIKFEFEDSDPATQNGFWPCKLNGKECGFEYSFGVSEQISEPEQPPAKRGWWARLFGSSNCVKTANRDEFDELEEAIGDRNSVASFKWHGAHEDAELDGRAASLAATTLAKLANGVFLDPQSGDFAVGAEALELLEYEDE
jgi:hypothetical protein